MQAGVVAEAASSRSHIYIHSAKRKKQGILRILRLLPSNYTNFKPNYFTAFLYNSSFKYVPLLLNYSTYRDLFNQNFYSEKSQRIKPREFLVIIFKKCISEKQ